MQGRKSQYIEQLQKHDFKKLSKAEKNQRIKLCLLAMDQVKKGKSICEVAKTFNVHFNSVRSWVKKFVNGGPKNLHRQAGQGRKRLLKKNEAFQKAVVKLKKNHPNKNIKGIDVMRMMEEKFDIKCCLSSVYVYLKRANIELVKANPKSTKKNK